MFQELFFQENLQYTLLLLIQSLKYPFMSANLEFTIHFATINTVVNLESFSASSKFTIHFATINTKTDLQNKNIVILFTIHFATINTSYP